MIIAKRAAPDVRRPRGCLLLHHPDERELPAPPLPEGREDGVREGIVKGMYLFREGNASKKSAPRVQLLGSGTILREAIAAAELLEQDWNVAADVWSAPSSPSSRARAWPRSDGTCCIPLRSAGSPLWRPSWPAGRTTAVAATDYVRAFRRMIRPPREAALPRSARTVSAAPITAGSSVNTSRSTGTSSPPWPRSPNWSPTALFRPARRAKPSPSTASIPTSPILSALKKGTAMTAATQTTTEVKASRHRRLQRRAGHRGARQVRRRRQRRRSTGHAGVGTKRRWMSYRRQVARSPMLVKVGDTVSEGTPI